MASKNNSNAESSDEDLETLYQINESRPPSRESASLSHRSIASPISVYENRTEQTMNPHESFVKTRNNRSNQERPQNDTENSGFDETHHDYPHRENLTSADVEGDYSKYPLTPTVVIVNSKTKQTEALPYNRNNCDRESRRASHTVPPGFVTEKSAEETIQQLTTRIGELTRQIDSQQTRKIVEHLPSRKSS